MFRANALVFSYLSIRELLCTFKNSFDSFSEHFLVMGNFRCVVPDVSRADLTL